MSEKSLDVSLKFLTDERNLDEIAHLSAAFFESGFEVTYRNRFRDKAPIALGVGFDSIIANRDALETLSQLQIPAIFEAQEITTVPQWVVAKRDATSHGVSKYLLEETEQKEKFLAFLMLNFNADDVRKSITINRDGEMRCQDPFLRRVDRLLDNVRKQEKIPIRSKRQRSWKFEQYLRPVGEYNTSLRVVSDGLGNIHYGAAIKSLKKQGAETLQLEIGEPLEWLFPMLEGWDGLELLLLHPQSPLFLKSKSIASYVSGKSEELILDGERVEDDEMRNELSALGINPDSPTLPPEVARFSGAIGTSYRARYPYVGIDFLIGDNKTLWHLETNITPDLAPVGLGLPEHASDLDCKRKIAHSMIATAED